ncbi:MAG TPA: hypothetical protein VHY32_08800 [Caulobacteraceae bacterium]|jgi:hypothetical protein|nr:hypothetical protein [Caulobacteraceae bacterium]
MDAHRRGLGASQVAEHQGQVLDRIEGGGVGDRLGGPDLGLDLEFLDPLDQPLARAAIGDQVGDRDAYRLLAGPVGPPPTRARRARNLS